MPSARIKVQVQPRASRDEVMDMLEDRVRIRLAAPPVDNAANEALVAFVAELLDIPKRRVRLAAGATSRKKELEIDGMSEQQARDLLLLQARQR
jgi:uncharacterized protein (TIGR00251 family)